MSAVETPPEAEQLACPRCGAAVRADQDWCLMCGTAVTTKVAGAPGWRTPVAVVGVVCALALVALVVAFLEISNDAEKVASAPSPAPSAAPAAAEPTVTASPTPAESIATIAPTATPAPTTSPDPAASPATSPGASPSPGTTATPGASPAAGGTVAEWPAGKRGWTVILASTTTEADAKKRAETFNGAGQPAGVLHSDEYSSLRAGYWVVFSGVYDTQEDAQKAAEAAQGKAPGAYAREVVPK